MQHTLLPHDVPLLPSLLGFLLIISFFSKHAEFNDAWSPPIARWGCPPTIFALRTPVGSEYYLRHLRTSACGTRARTGPRSWRRFAFFEDSSKALAELPTLTFVSGGGLKRRRQLDTSSSQYGSLMKSFCQRTKRKWVEEIGDGHCGIRSSWRQFDTTIGEETASMDSGHIRN